MTVRDTCRKRQEVLLDIYEENQKLLGRKISHRRKAPRQLTLILTSALLASLLFGGFEVQRSTESRMDEISLPEQEISASLTATRAMDFEGEAAGLSSVYGLGVRTIAIDPGHGGRDPGAVGKVGLTEKTLTLDLALRLEKRLQAQGFRVILTRRRDIGINLRQRVERVKASGADLFLSIHVNALPVDSIAFIETFYFSPRADARVEALAKRENAHSGYTLGSWQNSLEELGQTVKIEESQRLASHVQRSMVSTMREINPSLADWGTRSGPFMVLMNANVPAILAEVTAISMPEEEQRLMGTIYREQLVRGLESGILTYLSERRDSQTNVPN